MSVLDDSNLRQVCYLIDFGLSRRYLSANGKVSEVMRRRYEGKILTRIFSLESKWDSAEQLGMRL